MSKKIAEYISFILGGYVWLPVIFILIIFNSNLGKQQLLIIAPSVLILQVIIPLLYLLIGARLGWIGDSELSKREERKPFLIMMIILSLISLSIIYFFGNSFIFNLNIILITLLLILLAITNYWKISLHASLNTSAAIIINFLFDWRLSPLFLTIPLIFWSRLELKKHTLNQLVAGIIVSASIILLGFGLFGYL